jgi:hypothetical protein
MAIELEFIDFIVPIATIKAKYHGGWEQCLIDHQYAIGGRIWYDEHLFRDGAMNRMDMKSLVEHWQSMGFTTYENNDEGLPTKWCDVCVYESLFGGATLKCDWLNYDSKIGGIYLAGTTPGKLIGRSDFQKTQA